MSADCMSDCDRHEDGRVRRNKGFHSPIWMHGCENLSTSDTRSVVSGSDDVTIEGVHWSRLRAQNDGGLGKDA